MKTENVIFNNNYADNIIMYENIVVSDIMGMIFSPKFYIKRSFVNDFLIVYVDEGIFILNQYSKKYTYKQGDCVLISLRENHEYFTDNNNVAKIYFVQFKGYPIENAINLISKNKMLPISKKISQAKQFFSNLLNIIQEKHQGYEYNLSGLIYSLFSEMTGEAIIKLSEISNKTENKFKNSTLIYIRTHLTENISIDKISNSLGYSKSCFIKKYREAFDISPHKLMLKEKLSYACEILKSSDKSICEIAENLSFYDQSHFTKAFKHLYGISPLNYRLNNK